MFQAEAMVCSKVLKWEEFDIFKEHKEFQDDKRGRVALSSSNSDVREVRNDQILEGPL